MERTLKDRDIARMSAIKSAIELVAAFPNSIKAEAKDGLITTTLNVADKLYGWILQPAAPEEGQEEERISWHQRVLDECHALQERLNLKLTDFEHDPCPFGDWHNGGAEHLLETLKLRLKYGSEAGSYPGDVDSKGHKSRSIYDPGMGRNEYPISKKQFGYLIGLHKDAGLEYDKEELNALSSREASARIDELREIIEANGNGSDKLNTIKRQIRGKVNDIRSQL